MLLRSMRCSTDVSFIFAVRLSGFFYVQIRLRASVRGACR